MQTTADERLENFLNAGGTTHVSLNSVDRTPSSSRCRRPFTAFATGLSSSSGCSSSSNSSGVGFLDEEESVGL